MEFSAEQVESMAQLEHQLWSEEKIKDGWTYAPGNKDPEARINPDLVTWVALPENEKEKNRNLVAGLPLLLELARVSNHNQGLYKLENPVELKPPKWHTRIHDKS